MNKSKFLELRDIVVGDFAIKNGQLFYLDTLVAPSGQIILASSEEVFFLFELKPELKSAEFNKVILLNFEWPKIFTCVEAPIYGAKFLQFVDSNEQQHAYRLVSYNNSNTTKAVCSNFVSDVLTKDF